MKRNFQEELFTEIKFKHHCKKIDKDPTHFCTITELARNLKMSSRDVGKNLHACVERGLLTHDKVIVNHRLRDKFTPIDKRLVNSNEIIKMITSGIESNFETVRDLAKQMKKTPALTNLKQVKIKGTEEGTNTSAKINKKGMDYLNQFCDKIKDIFSYLDSMNYALFSDSIKNDSKNIESIGQIRKHTLTEIEKTLDFIFKDYSKISRKVILDHIIMKIPTYYMLLQIQNQAKRKI